MERTITILRTDKSVSKPMLFHPVTRTDRYRVGNKWFDMSSEWLHGYKVDEVSKGTMGLGFAVGDTIHAQTVNAQPIETFTVKSIEMCNLAEFNFAQVGYSDLADFTRQHPLFEEVKRCWLVRKTI